VNVVADLEGDPGPLGDGWAVFTIENGRVCARPVDVGRRTAAAVEVRGGIAEGAKIKVR